MIEKARKEAWAGFFIDDVVWEILGDNKPKLSKSKQWAIAEYVFKTVFKLFCDERLQQTIHYEADRLTHSEITKHRVQVVKAKSGTAKTGHQKKKKKRDLARLGEKVDFLKDVWVVINKQKTSKWSETTPWNVYQTIVYWAALDSNPKASVISKTLGYKEGSYHKISGYADSAWKKLL